MNTVTRLETKRLILRRPVATDIDAIFERYASSDAVTRYLAWPTHRLRDDTARFLALSDAHWAERPAGPYLIIARESGALLGGTGLQIESSQSAMTGYVLAQDAWGNGFATEALGAMVELAQRLGFAELGAHCHPQHRASQRVLEKCGFRPVGTTIMAGAFPNLPATDPGELRIYSRPNLKPE